MSEVVQCDSRAESNICTQTMRAGELLALGCDNQRPKGYTGSGIPVVSYGYAA